MIIFTSIKIFNEKNKTKIFKMFRFFRIIFVIVLVGLASSSRLPYRLARLGTQNLPEDLPLANYPRIDEHMTLEFNQCAFKNYENISSCDIVVNTRFGFKLILGTWRVDNRVPKELRFPEKYGGFEVIIPFHAIESIDNISANVNNYQISYRGFKTSLLITNRNQHNHQGHIDMVNERIKQEREYVRNLNVYLTRKLSQLVNQSVEDKKVIEEHSDNYEEDKQKVAELNAEIRKVTEELTEKIREKNKNEIEFNNANSDIGKAREEFDSAKIEKEKCDDELKTLKKTKDLLESYKKEYTFEKQVAVNNDIFSKQCKFHMACDDISLIVPTLRKEIYVTLKKVLKEDNDEYAETFFRSKSCFINKMN